VQCKICFPLIFNQHSDLKDSRKGERYAHKVRSKVFALHTRGVPLFYSKRVSFPGGCVPNAFSSELMNQAPVPFALVSVAE
jgi:hypothetical protein